MHVYSKYLFIVLFAAICFSVSAQTEGTAFNATGRGGTATTFVTDYQAIGINPANLGFDTKYTIALGIGEFGFSFYSQALVKNDVRNIIFNRDTSLTAQQQEDLGRSFLENGVTFNADVRIAGLSFRIPKFGTIGVSIDGSSAYHSKFGTAASQLIFEGYNYADYFDTVIVTPDDTFGIASNPLNLGQLTNGTSISFNVNSKFNLDYGTKIYGNDAFILYGGLGIKYILGFAYLNFKSDENTITGVSALGLNILPLDSTITSVNFTTSSVQPVGKGWGIDIGLSLQLANKITLGASIIDMGKMHYTANVLQLNNVLIDTVYFNGATTADPVTLIKQILQNQNIIAYSGLREFSVALPTTFRAGAGYEITDFLNVGIDMIFPLNDVAGAYISPVFGAGGEIKVAEVIKLSTGFSAGGGYSFNIPAGFGLDFKIWEAGIATRDILTVFEQNRPDVSFVAGFLRFKI